MTSSVEHLDVLIVGAGISGIGAAYHLQTHCPDRSFAILEGRENLGGTWDLFRYPGIRSDSDMHTLGYSFKPWRATKSIADGPSILQYLRETATENGIDHRIRFQHLVTRAEWSSEAARWTVFAVRNDTGENVSYTCGFLFMCSGYYSYKAGYTPEFEGRDRFTGDIVSPQQWPQDLAYQGKRVVIIGSGATAVTLVPAMAQHAEHVTMLQRSPTYVVSRPDRDVIANTLRKVLPDKVAYEITRWKNTFLQERLYKMTRSNPAKVKKQFLDWVRAELGPDFDVDRHFTPSYNPWDQRLCLVPNGDLFAALRLKKASVVTDHIETFTENGIKLQSGKELEADIIVTATGLQLVTLGEMDFLVDGEPVDFAKTWTYKGLAYSGVPNLASSFGYINASWTLRADLTCEYVCRLLNHMRETGAVQCTPRLRPADRDMPARPWIDDFSSGYMQRMMPMLPKQGDRAPWINTQRYSQDKKLFRKSPIDDGVMQFGAL
ncbi:MAG: flavin-containing monooxygenase [Pseudomonadales bacterium]